MYLFTIFPFLKWVFLSEHWIFHRSKNGKNSCFVFAEISEIIEFLLLVYYNNFSKGYLKTILERKVIILTATISFENSDNLHLILSLFMHNTAVSKHKKYDFIYLGNFCFLCPWSEWEIDKSLVNTVIHHSPESRYLN